MRVSNKRKNYLNQKLCFLWQDVLISVHILLRIPVVTKTLEQDRNEICFCINLNIFFNNIVFNNSLKKKMVTCEVVFHNIKTVRDKDKRPVKFS